MPFRPHNVDFKLGRTEMSYRADRRFMFPPTDDQPKMDHLEPDSIRVDEAYTSLSRDYQDDDADSAFSLASSKYNFHWENGRLYQDYRGNHPFPFDDMSQENERVFHSLIMYLLEDKLVAAPVNPDDFKNVLDVGSGVGLWAEDIADANTDCQVVGVDRIPHSSVFPNCDFLCFDVTEEWIFDKPNLQFDFVHIRSLFASLAEHDWPQLYTQCLQ